jgi:hypothetical protein
VVSHRRLEEVGGEVPGTCLPVPQWPATFLFLDSRGTTSHGAGEVEAGKVKEWAKLELEERDETEECASDGAALLQTYSQAVPPRCCRPMAHDCFTERIPSSSGAVEGSRPGVVGRWMAGRRSKQRRRRLLLDVAGGEWGKE